VKYQDAPFQEQVDYILGIDPGGSGGATLLGVEDDVIAFTRHVALKKKETLTAWHLQELLAGVDAEFTYAFLEKVGAAPGQGVSSMFAFGRAAGMWEGILESHEIPWTTVPPQVWCRTQHRVKAASAKAKSQATAIERWGRDIFIPPRGSVPHPGRVDSALIAGHGRLILLETIKRGF
jgi:crossover junction endodeoxyribonuclease RuvC